jgi:hypothetical protein
LNFWDIDILFSGMAAAFQNAQTNGPNPPQAGAAKPIPGKLNVPAGSLFISIIIIITTTTTTTSKFSFLLMYFLGLLAPKFGMPPPRPGVGPVQKTPPPEVAVSPPPQEMKPDKNEVKVSIFLITSQFSFFFWIKNVLIFHNNHLSINININKKNNNVSQ